MKNVVVIYWSGTGNTEMMAKAVAEGATAQGNMVKLMEVSEASKQDVLSADAVALGCPSMGTEELEEQEMEPFVQELEKEDMTGKIMALFGSYGWGEGEWMRDWESRMRNTGSILVDKGLILEETPDEQGLKDCRELGAKLVSD
ncbi:MAG: flavodoxin [Syntrophomonadaceae bacterium]|nr:flavodoxin [Syntrophomonadaceae bacterium]